MSKKSQLGEFWFVEDFNHVRMLAESVRINIADEEDVDKIYWLGRSCRRLLAEVKSLEEKLSRETQFQMKARARIMDTINDDTMIDSIKLSLIQSMVANHHIGESDMMDGTTLVGRLRTLTRRLFDKK